ncbi:MAG: hypothetical protein QOC76_6086 [Mycobacterium sp.]|nr:hypothetical protein [Mycobacterium sp.]
MTTFAFKLGESCRTQRRGCGGVQISQTTVGWLLFAAAGLTLFAGLGLRSLLGRRRETTDDGDLDDKILMPTFVLCCGLCLTAIFLLGYEALG